MQGILMKPDIHMAEREGRKTVTRRLDHLKEINQEPDKWFLDDRLEDGTACFLPKTSHDPTQVVFIKPRYHVDEVVYIKEAYCYESDSFAVKPRLRYKLGGIKEIDPSDVPIGVDIYNYLSDDYPNCIKWRTPLFMPASASRDFIKITGNRPERLQELTPEECFKEGIEDMGDGVGRWHYKYGMAITLYAELWDLINPNYPFSSNPWVWPYAFQCYEVDHV